jgi:hypothetical protein
LAAALDRKAHDRSENADEGYYHEEFNQSKGLPEVAASQAAGWSSRQPSR